MGCNHPNTLGCNNSHLHIPSHNANIRPAHNKELVSELELELGLELKVLLELQLEVPMELVMELVLQLVVLMEFEVLEMERCKIKNTISRDGGSTALKTAYTVGTVNFVDVVDTAHVVYIIETALHCLNSSTYTYIYC